MHEDVLSVLSEDFYGISALQVQLGATPAGQGAPPEPALVDDLAWRVPGNSDGRWLLGPTAAGTSAY